MAYITKADVQSLIGNTFTIPSNYTANSDAVLTAAIARASERIDTFTGQHWESINRRLILSGDGTDMLSVLSITTWAMNSISEVCQKDAYDDTFDLDGYVIPAASYRLHESRRFIQRVDGEVWTAGNANYRVTVAFGKTTTPAVVKQAAVLLVRNEIEPGHIDDWMPMYQESFPDGYSYMRAVETNTTLTSAPVTTGHPLVDKLLLPYRLALPAVVIGM